MSPVCLYENVLGVWVLSIYRWLWCEWLDVCRSFSHFYCFPVSLQMWWASSPVALLLHHARALNEHSSRPLVWEWKHMLLLLFIFMWEQEKCLGHHSIRKSAPLLIVRQQIFQQRTNTDHRIHLDLLLLLNDKRNTLSTLFKAATNILTNVPLNCSFYPLS